MVSNGPGAACKNTYLHHLQTFKQQHIRQMVLSDEKPLREYHGSDEKHPSRDQKYGKRNHDILFCQRSGTAKRRITLLGRFYASADFLSFRRGKDCAKDQKTGFLCRDEKYPEGLL
ncbi:hypothetical protein D3C86_1615880 [compost metagenome]